MRPADRIVLGFALMVGLSVAGCGATSSSSQSPAAPEPPPASAPATQVKVPLAPAPEPSPAVAEVSPPPPVTPRGPAFPEGTTVLVVGDSFSNSLGVGLRPILKPKGVRVVLQGKKATFIPEWAGTKMGMELAVMMHKPELVVIVLGGNELGIKDPSIRATRIQKVVANAKGRPCVWVAPALWELGDPNGLLEVIRQNSRPCRYFDSNRIVPELPRGSDKIHPDPAGQKKWAEAFIEWVGEVRDYDADGFALKPRPDEE